MNAYVSGLRVPLLILLACVLVFLSACNRRAKQNERLQKEWNAKCKEVADLLASINDPASAKTAEPKIRQAMEQMAKVGEKLETSYDPENATGSEAEKMTEAVGQGIVEMQRMMSESVRISKIPGATAALGDTWNMLPASALLENHGRMPRSK